MEKLLELLDEYQKGSFVYKGKHIRFYIGKRTKILAEPIIIYKHFRFIKWLVENDKIRNDGIKPRTDLVKEITIVDYETGDAIGWKNKYTEVEQLIMYLSIQDDPIRFLCEILK